MPSFTRQVSASTDDARIGIAGVFNLTDVRNNLGAFGAVMYHLNGRFLNVTVPQGATINSAVYEANCQTAAAANLFYILQCEDADNAATLSTEADYTGRSYTPGTGGSLVSAGLVVGTWYTIGDLRAEVQVVVNRAGWVSGNALLCRAAGTAGSTTNNIFYGWNGIPAQSVRVTIDYSDPVAGGDDRVYVGVSEPGSEVCL